MEPIKVNAGAAMPSGSVAQLIVFLVLAGATVGFSLFAITRRNPVTAVVSLVGAFLALAGIYATLSAHFLMILQIAVYAGAIMVLFIFVVMIMNRDEVSPISFRGIFTRTVGVLCGVYLFVVVASLVVRLREGLPLLAGPATEPAAPFGTVESVGRSLFVEFVYPFEAISVLLLVAIVGGLVVSRSAKQEQEAEEVARKNAAIRDMIRPETRLGPAGEETHAASAHAHGHH